MKILIFGATGMVGQGVLRECLEARDVSRVVAVGRATTGLEHERLGEIIAPDLFAISALREQLAPFDAVEDDALSADLRGGDAVVWCHLRVLAAIAGDVGRHRAGDAERGAARIVPAGTST